MGGQTIADLHAEVADMPFVIPENTLFVKPALKKWSAIVSQHKYATLL